MSAKDVRFGDESRQRMVRGVNILAVSTPARKKS